MIIIKANIKNKMEHKQALNAQLKGWIYESHFWEIPTAKDITSHKVCTWCGAVSITDMQIDTDHICPGNPEVQRLLEVQKLLDQRLLRD